MAAMNDDVDVPRITVIGVCTVLAVYVFITLTRVAFMQLEDEQTRIKLIDNKPRSVTKYQEEQDQKLRGGYRWSDEKARTVHLPIEVAMAKVTQELSSSHKLETVTGTPAPNPPRETTVIGVPNEPSTNPAELPKKAKARAVPVP